MSFNIGNMLYHVKNNPIIIIVHVNTVSYHLYDPKYDLQ